MRKKLIMPAAQTENLLQVNWLDLKMLTQIELTSEEALHPVELIFTSDMDHGWKAAEPGKQTIRLLFDQPQRIQHIRLQFREEEQARTQEFLLRYSSDGGKSYNDIVRQQYNFSPPETSQQIENYTVDLQQVTLLELSIAPDISGGNARASLAGWQLA